MRWYEGCSITGRAPAQWLDEKGVFVLGAALARAAALAQLAHGLHGRFEGADQGAPFADRADHGVLDRAQGLLEAKRHVGEHLVDALHLRGGQRCGARRVTTDGIEVAEQGLDVALELLREIRHAPGAAAGDDDDRNLRDGNGQRGQRNYAQKDVIPPRHVFSRRACW